MDNKQLTIVALKGVAIFLFIKVLLGLPNTINALRSFNTWFDGGISNQFVLLSALVVIGISLGLAFFIWRLANSVARSTLGNEMKTIVDIPNEKDIEPILLSVLGLFLMIYSMSGFSYGVASLMVIAGGNEYPDGIPADFITYVFTQVIIFLLGISLILKPTKWGAMLQKFRALGLKNK